MAEVRARDYRESLPGTEDVLLVIEVSNATLGYDREIKVPFYGRAGLPKSETNPRSSIVFFAGLKAFTTVFRKFSFPEIRRRCEMSSRNTG